MKNLEDNIYSLLSLYQKSPQVIKSTVGFLYSKLPNKIKYGRAYCEFNEIIKKAEAFLPSDFHKYQWEQLKLVLNEAFNYVPFYQEYYSHYGLSIDDIKDFNGFSRLPIINKKIIKSNLEKFISVRNSKLKLKMNTGGSSGEPLSFYIQKGITRPKERAFITNYINKFKYNEADKIATFRGTSIPGDKLFFYDPIKNDLVFSSYQINTNNVKSIVEKLNLFKPALIQAYPSVLYDLSVLIQRRNLHIENKELKTIVLASEKVYDEQLKKIEEVFKVKPTDFYGHSERLILAYRCTNCTNYIPERLYGYLELVDENNKIIEEPKRKGRIIATGFHNFVMPLIRYDTNDEAILTDNGCNECKNNGLLLSTIEGRESDYLIGKDGRKISITAIIFGQHLDALNKIDKFQLEQYEPGIVDVNIIPLESFKEIDKELLKRQIADSSKDTIDARINLVKKIKKTQSGKFLYLLQHI